MSENGTRVRSVHVLVHGTVQGVGFRYHCLTATSRSWPKVSRALWPD